MRCSFANWNLNYFLGKLWIRLEDLRFGLINPHLHQYLYTVLASGRSPINTTKSLGRFKESQVVKTTYWVSYRPGQRDMRVRSAEIESCDFYAIKCSSL